jgi:peptide deformylase
MIHTMSQQVIADEGGPMALLRQIAQLGNPVLRTPAAPLILPAGDAVQTLIADMLATLEDAGGVGIAAPQVYEPAAIFIVASRPNPRYPTAPLMRPEVVINPTIIERSDERVKDWEGCLSIPGLRGLVPRHRRIRARYQTVEGAVVEREFVDFVARIFQHEDDHLRGIVFLDRLESTRDVVTEKEYQKQFARSEQQGSPLDSQAASGAPPRVGEGGED